MPYPPKAPASVALQRKIAIRVARSSGLYQKDMKKIMPGKTPASAAPRKNLRAVTPAKLVVPAIPQQKAPKAKTRNPSHLQGNQSTWEDELARSIDVPVWGEDLHCQVRRRLEDTVGHDENHQGDGELVVCHVVGLRHRIARVGIEDFGIAYVDMAVSSGPSFHRPYCFTYRCCHGPDSKASR